MPFLHYSGYGQTAVTSLSSETISLEDLTSFQNTKKENWKLAGAVSADRNLKGKMDSRPGKGILIFEPGKSNSSIVSAAEFGDLDLELDFLLTKGSSFSVLLHNQYQLVISDLWMKTGNEALKAPGLWQHLHIQFKAHVFDSKGKKLKNGRLERILLNGQIWQGPSDVVASGPDIKKIEKPTGPFALMGRNWPFAVRNIQYKTYGKERIQLSDIGFKVFAGLHKNIDTLQTLTPRRTGITDTLSHRVGDRKSQLVLNGVIEIPRNGDYLFKLTAGGGAWFLIDQKLIIENRGSRDFERAFYKRVTLKKGKYPFQFVYSNSDECLVLHYEGPQIPWQSLTTPASVRLSELFEPLEYKVTTMPVFQRGFMMHQERINPYTASMGLPGGNNYAYDMRKYNLLAAWHGRFIDVSNMWRERGEKQLEIPLGAKLEFSGRPLIAKLANPQAAWPDSAQTPDGVFASRGYKLNGAGLPVYFYNLNQNSVEDLVHATNGNEGLTRELKISNTGTGQAYVLLAEGKIIEKLTNGTYAIDDKNYYLENLEIVGGTAIIRQDEHVQQLVVPFSNSNKTLTIKYNIIW